MEFRAVPSPSLYDAVCNVDLCVCPTTLDPLFYFSNFTPHMDISFSGKLSFQDPPDVLPGGLFSAPVDPALGPLNTSALEAPGAMDDMAFPLPTVSNMQSAAVARRPGKINHC